MPCLYVVYRLFGADGFYAELRGGGIHAPEGRLKDPDGWKHDPDGR
jgi:hypothetical protein